MIARLARSPITWLAVAVLVAATAIGAVWFQPWRLFTDVTVSEAPPTAAADPAAPEPAAPRVLARGTFLSHEHATSGTVAVLALPDGSRVLRIEDLDTSDGPDLHVWLSDAPVIDGVSGWGVFDDGRYADLGGLKGNKGDQNYPVPATVDLSVLTSVSIWCDRFNVSFGAAELHPV
ncbi:DM13 domain-containing protein [Nocardia puris]|uniref:Electron transfer DM13 n=1 Tax=Nocardia puris TaxID=208602 RepID=A0A366DUM3_9NOCA|nr:DM13 domain-containing protein [Nocardia puris]MBF6210367.1 DM13 domain-containing protein [Nocardia puris]MBF6367442.1 DM13 domain-containing protein [Nocardia puris]MBF6457627.1 DM13 domain-containing protein [Nocardia puris]RBO93790.1 electron transfer DM13 [Nocardia puris]